ncbi:MAG TPA: ABC transporter permease [Candidatus Cryosericum sp.]|nr:ABC transporter permease [Candidatus Cryosericum sp.]
MKLKRLFYSNGFISLLASIASICFGLLLGFILLCCFNPPFALTGFKSLITAGFRNTDKFAKVLYQAAPLVMTGLSVAFAFKTGLFNIGATGQYTVGAAFALIGAIEFQLPWYLCLLLAMIGGAIWGVFPGLFKALFNVHEVITSIMFNWIGMFAVNLTIVNLSQMLAKDWGLAQMDRTAPLATANPGAILPKLGLDKLMQSNYMNVGIFIAIGIAILMYVILHKTVFGYELKACGYNRNASIYAGINAKRNIVLSMVISGALAGIGGGLYYLAGTGQYSLAKALLSMGFNGIPVALLASSDPLGTIFSALFISYIQVGGDAMQPEFVREIIDIIVAAILYLSAFSLLLKNIFAKWIRPKEDFTLHDAPAVKPSADQISVESEANGK